MPQFDQRARSNQQPVIFIEAQVPIWAFPVRLPFGRYQLSNACVCSEDLGIDVTEKRLEGQHRLDLSRRAEWRPRAFPPPEREGDEQPRQRQ